MVYKGQFEKGTMHGQGKLSCDTFIYDGEFKNGEINGLGKIKYLKT